MAQLGRPAILSKINTFITENTSGAITATQMNEILRDIADSCFNIDSDESLPPSLVDVLSQGNSTQGNGINLTTNDFIYNEEVPFVLGYDIDGDKNQMAMAGYDADKVTYFLLREELGEHKAQMGFSDFNTGSDHWFHANINGLGMESENSNYRTQVNINPSLHESQVHSQINGANTGIGQSPDSVYNYVNDPQNDRSTFMYLHQDRGILGSNDFVDLDLYSASVNVIPTTGVVLSGSHTNGGNTDFTEVTVKPEYFLAQKNNHRLLVDPEFKSVGTGFYTTDDSGLIVSDFSIEHKWINLNSTDQTLNKTTSLYVSHQEPLVNLTARDYLGGNLRQSTVNVEPETIALGNYSMLTPNLASALTVKNEQIRTFLVNTSSPDTTDHFITETLHSVDGVFTRVNYSGLNKYSESYVYKDFIKLSNSTNDDSIDVSIENGAVTFKASIYGDDGQTLIDPLGVSTDGSYISSSFGQGLGNSSSGFAVLWYDAPIAHTEPVMTIGSWNPETSTGIGMQISEYGLWSNMESSLDGDQYFLADVYLQNSRVFADNAAAVAGGLPIGAMYHTTTGEVRVRV